MTYPTTEADIKCALKVRFPWIEIVSFKEFLEEASFLIGIKRNVGEHELAEAQDFLNEIKPLGIDCLIAFE